MGFNGDLPADILTLEVDYRKAAKYTRYCYSAGSRPFAAYALLRSDACFPFLLACSFKLGLPCNRLVVAFIQGLSFERGSTTVWEFRGEFRGHHT